MTFSSAHHAGHEIVRCTCGALVEQCRCADMPKPIRIVRGCRMCGGTGQPPVVEAQRPETD